MVKVNKSSQLMEALKDKRVFSSADAVVVGVEIFYSRAPRTVRDWAREGLVRRIPDFEAEERGLVKPGRAQLAWYEFNSNL
ncbi:conserved hypothetical protein [Gammaproteobacteria bacterium]